jgi:hypothetical protein
MDNKKSGDEDVLSSDTYEVGYGKPPKATRFGARPQPARANRRTSRSQNPDIAALLDRPIEALIGGKKAKLHPHEAMLHGLFQRVVAGDIRAIKLFLEECKRAKLLDPTPEVLSHGVIEVPKEVPIQLAARLVSCAGPPPWDAELFDQLKAEYERDLAHIEQLKQEAKALNQGAMYHEQDS